jgi:hypothetical protein
MKAIISYKGGSFEINGFKSTKFKAGCSGLTFVYDNSFAFDRNFMIINDAHKKVGNHNLQRTFKIEGNGIKTVHIYSGTEYSINIDIEA